MNKEIKQKLLQWIPCQICGRKPATKQCDAPIGTTRTFICNRAARKLKITEDTITCDKHICDDCAVSAGANVDYCLDCIEKNPELLEVPRE